MALLKRAGTLRLAIFLLAITSGILLYFTTGLSQLSPAEFVHWVQSFGIYAGIIFIALYIIAPVLLIPGSILSLSAGTLFGPALGTLYVIIGASIGAILAFYFARYFGHAVHEQLSKAKALNISRYDRQLQRNGFVVVLITRLIPLFPYNLLNYAYGISMVRARDYILGTLIGIIPGTFAFVFLGSNIFNIGSKEFYLAITLFAAFMIIPIVLRKKISARLAVYSDF